MDKETAGMDPAWNGNGLSYKYQRLRERLRQAVRSGEFSGKLPGERSLARQFRVNAKTLSKALTDLAAEGILDRSIGRGTFVRGAAPAGFETGGRWMVVCEADRSNEAIVGQLMDGGAKVEVISDVAALRPSVLNKFDAIIDLTVQPCDRFLRDMQVRGMRVVAVDREPGVFSVNAVSIDRGLGAACLARDLVLGGHRRFAVIESGQAGIAGRAFRQMAGRYCGDAVVRECTIDDLLTMVQEGATAVVCDGVCRAGAAREVLESSGLRIPLDVSLVALGACDSPYPCSGQYVDFSTLIQALREVLGAMGNHHPATVWLAPRWVEKGTTRALPVSAGTVA